LKIFENQADVHLYNPAVGHPLKHPAVGHPNKNPVSFNCQKTFHSTKSLMSKINSHAQL
jgi:hypothetical protein